MERYVYEVVEALGLEVSCYVFNLKYGFISFNTKSGKLLLFLLCSRNSAVERVGGLVGMEFSS